ncbi:hypothetical protein R3W88_026893 [Solanum pinnatisectum]|uniref:Uncharacterized protein n=1 Tax=Solanum pinnatisectum TaxID=50273 RepID=A0AAV9LH61_9SOLN|nr:hypothetical protein R3W88_026893 [Solanum pinnatisectum]
MSRGSFMKKSFLEIMSMMDEVSKNKRAWHTRDAEVGDLRFTFELSDKQKKREEERDQDLAHIRTLMDFLTKHIMAGSEKGKYSGSSSSGSRMEDMIAKVLQKVESTDIGAKEMRNDFSIMSQLEAEVDVESKSDAELTKEGEKLMKVKEAAVKVTLPLPQIPRPPTLFSQRLKKRAKDGKFSKFIAMLRQLSVNIMLAEALEQMPSYAKFMKDLVTKERAVSFKPIDNIHHCSATATKPLVQKKEDPSTFTIPCTISTFEYAKALCDLGASINMMPLPIYKQLGLGIPKPTSIRLMIADRSVRRPVSILCDILMKVDSFIFPVDFVILDFEVDFEVPKF